MKERSEREPRDRNKTSCLGTIRHQDSDSVCKGEVASIWIRAKCDETGDRMKVCLPSMRENVEHPKSEVTGAREAEHKWRPGDILCTTTQRLALSLKSIDQRDVRI